MKQSNNRLYYFDILRIIATFFVITIHICILNWELLEPTSFDWKVLNVFESISQIAVPLFFMISGALFLDPTKEITIKDLYTKYILRLVVAYLLWSMLYVLLSGVSSYTDFIVIFVKGHYHMWFIPAIIGCYMTVPFLRKITESEKLTKYFILLAIIFSFTLNFIVPIMTKSSNKLIYYAGDLIQTTYTRLKFRLALSYSGYFVIGYYLNKTDFNKNSRHVIYLMGITALLATMCFSYFFSVNKNAPDNTFYNNFSLNILLQAVAVFVFAKYHLSPNNLSSKSSKALSFVSKCTFGVYLVHPLFISLINNYFHINAIFINPVITVPVFTLVTFVLSFTISTLLNKIPFVKKYFV